MTPVHTALVLQGGGALGAYELGAARALFKGTHFAPDLIATRLKNSGKSSRCRGCSCSLSLDPTHRSWVIRTFSRLGLNCLQLPDSCRQIFQ